MGMQGMWTQNRTTSGNRHALVEVASQRLVHCNPPDDGYKEVVFSEGDATTTRHFVLSDRMGDDAQTPRRHGKA